MLGGGGGNALDPQRRPLDGLDTEALEWEGNKADGQGDEVELLQCGHV